MPTSHRLLEHTFLHLPRVGRRTERKLWMEGIATWSDFQSVRPRQLSLFNKDTWEEIIDASRKALAMGDADFFAARLPRGEHYRVAATFPEETVFLDIETTGLSLYYDNITLVGLSKGEYYTCCFRQLDYKNNDSEKWREFLSGAKCLVTFNGTMFDLKFIEKYIPDLKLPAAHVDLRFLARRVSLTGGQKAIEEAVGIRRPEGIGDVSGREAILLWYEYAGGNIEAGKRLVRYNHTDIEGMKIIFDEVFERIIASDFPPTLKVGGSTFSKSHSSIDFVRVPSRADNTVHIVKYTGRRGPAVHYDDLFSQGAQSSLRIVGIDLSGSERRPTGWCVLDGRRAVTRVFRTDEEMIEEIKAIEPHLVSIDSPLSLPAGRRSVGDDDLGRSKYGITRECERILRSRGIHVYPCLIPSMQMLTRRGIELARNIRAMGIPVIESYPGAAQDIMNIPRKRASLDQLKKGLQLFGIEGNFLLTTVTHDEVDAITSAVVGLFFWQGRYEALGNEIEDFLIIPDLKKRTYEKQQRRVVGISGTIAAGKTTAAEHLASEGFAYGRYSQVLANIVRKSGGTVDRSSLQQLGSRIHHDPGQRWLNQQLLASMPQGKDLVIDGLRWPEDHAFWVERFGPWFFHLHISTASSIREQRHLMDGHTSEEFDVASRHNVEHGTGLLEALSSRTILNDQALTTFKQMVSEVADTYYKENVQCRFR